MSKSARSVFVFGLYVAVLGIMMIVIPNVLLRAIHRPSTTEVWIRVVGMFLVYLGFYYTQAARKEMTDFFRWTVYTRSTVIVFFAAFVLLGFSGPPMIMFGVIDLLGAIWTGLALRSQKKHPITQMLNRR
jgi:Kef-type K+ transport system membrane component KefB